MKELNAYEVEQVGGANLLGMILGAVDGATTGMAIGSKWATGGGWGLSVLSQFFGITVGPILGAIYGGVIGLETNERTVLSVLSGYRNKYGK